MQIIDITALVRAYGEIVRLHIVGKSQPNAQGYLAQLRDRVRDTGAWVSLHEDLPRTQLIELVARQRYGIHAQDNELFGIVVAEMMRAGYVVFTPRSGGQVEITGKDERLVYGSAEEAAVKILALMRSACDLAAVRDHLAGRKELFSTARFVRVMQEVVRQFQPQRQGLH